MDLNATLDFQRMQDILETELGTTLGAADERLLLLRAIYLVLLNQNAKISRGYSERLLRHMTGEFLNEFGEGRGVARSGATHADTMLRFRVQVAQPASIVIPRGTRATTQDQSIYFATNKTAIIEPGQMNIDVDATALTAGEEGNGIGIGQISVIVDPTPFVAQVENITVSGAGSDIESDIAYRERIRLELSKHSTAGARETYQYYAREANPLISSVTAEAPLSQENAPAYAGVVVVTVLMQGGQIPEQSVLDDVYDAVNAESIRPLTDYVIVQAPEVVAYNIDFDYYVPEDQAETVREAVEGEGGAIQQYLDWQMSELGRNVTPDYLRKLVVDAGATRVILREPEYIPINTSQVAHAGDVNAVLKVDGDWP